MWNEVFQLNVPYVCHKLFHATEVMNKFSSYTFFVNRHITLCWLPIFRCSLFCIYIHHPSTVFDYMIIPFSAVFHCSTYFMQDLISMSYVIAKVLAAESYMHIIFFFVLFDYVIFHASIPWSMIIYLRLLGINEKATARKVLVTLGDNNKNAHHPRKKRFISYEKPKPLFNHCKSDVALKNRGINSSNRFYLDASLIRKHAISIFFILWK